MFSDASSLAPRRYRIVYEVRRARLHLGRPVGYTVQCHTAIVATADVAVLLTDLFECHRGQPDFLGLQVLRISRRLPAHQPQATATQAGASAD